MKKYSSNLVEDLLAENRYWTFWSSDWTLKVDIFWEGKTKWRDVVNAVKERMFKMNKNKLIEIHNLSYERQVILCNPDMSFK